MPHQRALARRLGFKPGSLDYETTAQPTELLCTHKRLCTQIYNCLLESNPDLKYYFFKVVVMSDIAVAVARHYHGITWKCMLQIVHALFMSHSIIFEEENNRLPLPLIYTPWNGEAVHSLRIHFVF